MSAPGLQQEGPTTLDDAPNAVLERIFAYVCATAPAPPHGEDAAAVESPKYRHCPAIPQVCRRWAEVYVQSSLLWSELRLDWAALAAQAAQHSPPQRAAALAAGATWLSARLPYARRLRLHGCHALAPPADPAPFDQLFLGGVHSTRLQELHILDAWGALGGAVVALLQRCPRLQSLTLACPPRAEGSPTALAVEGALLSGLVCLPELTSLSLCVDKLTGTSAEQVPALRGLTRLSVRCRMESAALAPELLEGLSQLRRLELGNVRLAQFTPRLAQTLSSLTHLACIDVLAAHPRRRAGTQLWAGLRHLASLRELRLEQQAGACMPANALACRGLAGLTLIGCEARAWPLAPYQFAGEGGCLGTLASLHLESLHLPEPIPAQLWPRLAPGLTRLTWRNVLRCQEGGLPFQLAAAPHARMQALEVPAELAHLQELRELRLEYAGLDAVPQAVQALPHLTCLSLSGNRISTLPLGAFLTRLERLSLANNSQLAGLPEALAVCSRLRHLSLVGNLLSISPAAAEQLAATLRALTCLRVSLPTAPPHGPPAAAAGAGPGLGAALAAAGVAPAAVGQGQLPGVPEAGEPVHAAQQGVAEARSATQAHFEAVRHLARAFGPRLLLAGAG